MPSTALCPDFQPPTSNCLLIGPVGYQGTASYALSKADADGLHPPAGLSIIIFISGNAASSSLDFSLTLTAHNTTVGKSGGLNLQNVPPDPGTSIAPPLLITLF